MLFWEVVFGFTLGHWAYILKFQAIQEVLGPLITVGFKVQQTFSISTNSMLPLF